jgi:hypothetical protein
MNCPTGLYDMAQREHCADVAERLPVRQRVVAWGVARVIKRFDCYPLSGEVQAGQCLGALPPGRWPGCSTVP